MNENQNAPAGGNEAACLQRMVGRSVSVRNVIDHHGINGMDWLDEAFRIAGAPKYVEAVIVSVHPCWRGPGFGYVRVEYPATYFGGRLPRYANVAMRRLRAPNNQGVAAGPHTEAKRKDNNHE